MTDTKPIGAAAFREIQRVLVVLKTQYNKHSDFYYRSLEDINLQLKPLLAKYDFSLIYSDDVVEIANNAYVKATAVISDDKGIFIMKASSVARDSMSTAANISLAPMATNSASSFARKQAVSGLFLLDDSSMVAMSKDEQEDAEKVAEEVHEAEQEKAAQHKADIDAAFIEFTDEAAKNIKGCLSIQELSAIYKALWKKCKTDFGEDKVSTIENIYFTKRDVLKKEESNV